MRQSSERGLKVKIEKTSATYPSGTKGNVASTELVKISSAMASVMRLLRNESPSCEFKAFLTQYDEYKLV